MPLLSRRLVQSPFWTLRGWVPANKLFSEVPSGAFITVGALVVTNTKTGWPTGGWVLVGVGLFLACAVSAFSLSAWRTKRFLVDQMAVAQEDLRSVMRRKVTTAEEYERWNQDRRDARESVAQWIKENVGLAERQVFLDISGTPVANNTEIVYSPEYAQNVLHLQRYIDNLMDLIKERPYPRGSG